MERKKIAMENVGRNKHAKDTNMFVVDQTFYSFTSQTTRTETRRNSKCNKNEKFMEANEANLKSQQHIKSMLMLPRLHLNILGVVYSTSLFTFFCECVEIVEGNEETREEIRTNDSKFSFKDLL